MTHPATVNPDARDDREGLSPPPHPLSIALRLDDDDDDDDMEYEPASEEGEDMTQTETEEDGESDYMDANDGIGEIQIEFSIADENYEGGEDEQPEDGNHTETEQAPATHAETGRTATARMAIDQIHRVLRSNGPLRRLLMSQYRVVDRNSRELEDNAVGLHVGYRTYARPRGSNIDKFPKVPSEHGKSLMDSGVYGCNEYFVDKRRRRKNNLSERLMWRRLGLDVRGSSYRANRLLAQDMIPTTTVADKIIHYDSPAYSGQFSDDGNFFFSCTQNFKVRMYDTSNPYDWKYYKTVDYPFGQWTITDATLSPDNRFLAYSSIRHMVCLATTDPSDHSEHNFLDFTNFADGSGPTYAAQSFGFGRHGFGIWSLRFSGDGREIVAGTSANSVVVYDIERGQSILKLHNHEDDVNAVCFGDSSSPHILYSGSDDQTLRVWDRRSMSDGREAGVFVGHTEGLTYVDSKGDGRYVLSNGKDQMMKLWDLRKIVEPSAFDKMDLREYTTSFDYRFAPYDVNDYQPNPHDCSVVTFRGHRVLKTLIRCHFSPPGSTNSRYVYSGSEDGKVWIWNIDGTPKAKIDVTDATTGSRPRQTEGHRLGYEYASRNGTGWKTCVRDASWNPTAPTIAATSWNGWGMNFGTVTLHSWNDGNDQDEADPPLGSNYNSRLDSRPDYDEARRTRGGVRSNPVRTTRATARDDDDDDGW